MFELIWEALSFVWSLIKKVFIRIVSFTAHIVSFFKTPDRLRQLKENKDLLAIAIKRDLDNGNYNTVNCLFNEDTGEVEEVEDDALSIESEGMDATLRYQFGDKDMLVLK